MPENKKLSTRMADLKKYTKWDMPAKSGKPLAGKALDSWLDEKEQAAHINAVERGIGYLVKKYELGHGAFSAWVSTTGRGIRSVQDSIKAAQLLIGLSDSNTQRVAHLSTRKINVLAALPAAVVDDMYEDGLLDDAENIKQEDLRELVSLRKQLEKQQALRDKAEDQLAAQLSRKPITADLHPRVKNARVNGTICAEQAVLLIDSIEKNLAELDEVFQDIDDAEYYSSVSSIYLNVRAIWAKSAHLINRMVEEHDAENLPDDISSVPVITETEMVLIDGMRDMLIREHTAKEIASRATGKKGKRKAGKK